MIEPEVSQTQKKRLFHIEFRLNFLGSIGRNDLISRFGIKEAAATRDIAEYKRLAASNLYYDIGTRRYLRCEAFKPVFHHSARQVLTALAQGFGEDFVGVPKAMIPSETPTQLINPSLDILSVLSRAIYTKRPVRITYCSLSTGHSCREIVPFALADNGLRWHIRAYDRKKERFGDFVITRISEASLIDAEVHDHETRDADNQWNRVVQLELMAHPKITHPEAIELDYGMVEGVLKLNVRAALTGYLLRRWNVDCSTDHRLRGEEIHLWLRNSGTLYGVENLTLAPGVQST